MKILDLINKSAIMLNIQEVLSADLTSITQENEAGVLESNFTLKRLYEFTKIVLNEINSYLPKIKEIECATTDKKIPLSTFTRLTKIIGVKNEFGYVKYSIVDDSIEVAEDGDYTVIFNQCPQIDSLLIMKPCLQ